MLEQAHRLQTQGEGLSVAAIARELRVSLDYAHSLVAELDSRRPQRLCEVCHREIDSDRYCHEHAHLTNARSTVVDVLGHAMRLREYGNLTYADIAWVMGEYHGAWYSPDYWRQMLREAGAIARPQGRKGYPPMEEAKRARLIAARTSPEFGHGTPASPV